MRKLLGVILLLLAGAGLSTTLKVFFSGEVEYFWILLISIPVCIVAWQFGSRVLKDKKIEPKKETYDEWLRGQLKDAK